MTESIKFENANSLNSKELKTLQELAKDGKGLENMKEDELKQLKDSLEAEKDGYMKRSHNEKSKQWIGSLFDKVISKIDNKLGKVEPVKTETIEPVKTETIEPVKTETIEPVKTETIEVSPVEHGEKIPENVLTEFGLDPKNFEGIEIKGEAINTLNTIKEQIKIGNTETAKKLFVDIIKDSSNIEDTKYEESKKKIEKALKELKEKSFKVENTDDLNTIDNLEGYIINNINDKLSSTKVKIEEGGKEKEMSIADYLTSREGTFSIQIENGKLKISGSQIDEKVNNAIIDIIKDSIPKGTDISKLNFSIKLDNGVFSSDAKINDIDSTNGKKLEEIVKLSGDIDLTKDIDPKTLEDINENGIYKVKFNEKETKLVSGKELKSFLEEKHEKAMEEGKEKIKQEEEKLEQKHENKINELEDKIDDIKIDENKLLLEGMGLQGLEINKTTPSIEAEENGKYIIDINGQDDLVISDIKLDDNGKATEITIRDENKLLPKISIKGESEITNFKNSATELSKIIKYMNDTSYDIKDLQSRIDNWGDSRSGNTADSFITSKEKLEQELKEKEEILGKFENNKTLDDVLNTYKEINKEKEEAKKQEETQEKFEEHLDKLKSELESIKIDKKDVKNVSSEWLDEFGDNIEFDINSTKEEGDNLIINMDFDDKWTNEEFNKNINIIIPKEKITNTNSDEIKNFIMNNVAPSISKLQEKSKTAWSDENQKTFKFE